MASFSLLSSTRYDKALLEVNWNTQINGGTPSSFLLLPYHLDRIADGAKQHGWTEHLTSLSLGELTRVCNDAVASAAVQHGDVPMKVGALPVPVRLPAADYGHRKLRILCSADGVLSAAASPAVPLQNADLTSPQNLGSIERIVYIDPQRTFSSIFTSTKSTQRALYNDARARVGLSPLPSSFDAHIDVLLHTPTSQVLETSIRNIAFRRGDVWVTPAATTGCLPGVMRRLLLERGAVTEGDIEIEDVELGETVLTFNSVEGCWLAKVTVLSQ